MARPWSKYSEGSSANERLKSRQESKAGKPAGAAAARTKPSGSGSDSEAARAEILETLVSYGARTRAELLNAVQTIALGMTSLDMVHHAKTTEMSPSMRLRFIGCANNLTRNSLKQEEMLTKRLACDKPGKTNPQAEPVNDVPDAEAEWTLAEIGVGTNRDGTLSLDATQLSKALASFPDQIEAMFADATQTVVSVGPTSVTSGKGLLTALGSISAGAASSLFGLTASTNTYTKAQSDLADQQTKLQKQEDDTRTRLTQQFSNMDAMVASYKSTQTFLQQQIDAWNGKNGNG